MTEGSRILLVTTDTDLAVASGLLVEMKQSKRRLGGT